MNAAPASVCAALALHAATRPQAPAYVDNEGVTGYGDLHMVSRRAAGWLARQGVRPGDIVALSLDAGVRSAGGAAAMLYAIGYAGAVCLPLPPETPLAVRVALLERFGAAWMLVAGAPPRVAGARTLDPGGFNPADATLDRASLPEIDPDAPCIYLFTSGTTGMPKVLLPTHRQVVDKSVAAMQSLGADSSDRLMAPVPWPAGMGMRYMMRAHAIGAAYVAVLLAEPLRELAGSIARHGITRMYASPWQLRRLLQGPPHAGPMPALRSLSAIGAFISAGEVEAVRAAITSNLYVDYGCNEVGAIALLGPGDAAEPGCVGRLQPGVEVRIDDGVGGALPAGEVGELAYRTPWMCHAYTGNSQATRERFRGGWFYPGDAGSVDARGCLTLRGRTQDLINYGGVKIWPEDIEAVLKQHPGVLDAAVAGLPDPLAGQVPAAFIVRRTPFNMAELEVFCEQRVDGSRVPRWFFLTDSIPRNENGKVMREALLTLPRRAADGTPL